MAIILLIINASLVARSSLCVKYSSDQIIIRDERQDRMREKLMRMSYQHVTRLRTCLLLLSLMIDNVVNLTSSSLRHSGLYVDNGQDQTMIHELETEKAKIALEHEILKLLGLPDKPKAPNGKAPLMTRSAPKFLLNIYENGLGNRPKKRINASDDLTEFYLTGRDLNTINQSDVIITFSAQQKHQGAGGKPDRVKRIWFDVSDIPTDGHMTSAELRLYRGPDAKNHKNRGPFTITVYRVLRRTSSEREMQFVDAVNTTAGQEGWITMNVTESLNYWMKNPSDNRGLYVSVSPIGRISHETRPEDIGIIGFKGDAERQPFMAGFFESDILTKLRVSDDEAILESIKIDSMRLNRNHRRDISDVRDLLKNHYKGKVIQSSTRPCKIHTLHVSFKDLQWQDWIIAPEGYDAYYCGGECKFPLNTRMNATNHAIVQTLVHLLDPKKVPKPCCAPTQLSAISVLYFLDDNNVILKKYKNMAVQGCGCH